MKRLGIEQIIKMHSALIKQSGGLNGIQDVSLLDLSVNAPFQTFDGQYIYPTLQAKAARLAFSLVKNHPFIDGNKRIGILAMLVFLELNGIEPRCHDEELINLGLGLADGSIDDKDLMRWIFTHS